MCNRELAQHAKGIEFPYQLNFANVPSQSINLIKSDFITGNLNRCWMEFSWREGHGTAERRDFVELFSQLLPKNQFSEPTERRTSRRRLSLMKFAWNQFDFVYSTISASAGVIAWILNDVSELKTFPNIHETYFHESFFAAKLNLIKKPRLRCSDPFSTLPYFKTNNWVDCVRSELSERINLFKCRHFQPSRVPHADPRFNLLASKHEHKTNLKFSRQRIMKRRKICS